MKKNLWSGNKKSEEKDRNNEKGSKNESERSQKEIEEEISLSAFY